MCGTCGMDVRQAKWRYGVLNATPRRQDPKRTRSMADLRTSIMGLSAGAKPDLIMVILSSDDKVFYAALKSVIFIYSLVIFTANIKLKGSAGRYAGRHECLRHRAEVPEESGT